jgi:hypothetical protein
MIPRKVPNVLFDESEVEDYGGTVEIKNKLSGFSFSGEYRFYTSSSKDSPRGFYFAPFLKYNKYSMDISAGFDYDATKAEYDDLTPEQQATADKINSDLYRLEVTGNFHGHLRQFGGGVMIGYQWLIADKISIDFNFFGIGVEADAVVFDLSSDAIDVDYEEWSNEIEAEVKDASFYGGDKIQVTAESDKVKVKAPFIMFMPRVGFSIGYAF